MTKKCQQCSSLLQYSNCIRNNLKMSAEIHLLIGVTTSADYSDERPSSDLRQLGFLRYVFMVSHTPVSRLSRTAIFKWVNKALYYSAKERARKSTGTVPTCHSVCGKPDKQEQAGISVCQVRYLFINPAPMLKWFTEHLLGEVAVKRLCCLSWFRAAVDKVFIWHHFRICFISEQIQLDLPLKHNTEFMTLKWS